MKEKWKPVKGYGGRYLISNMGRIRSIRKVKKKRYPWSVTRDTVLRKQNVLLYPSLDRANIVRIKLTLDKKVKNYQLKDLVADHWLRPRGNGIIKLKDESNPFNCSVSNLKEIGLKKKNNQKLTIEEIKEIRKRLKENSYRGIQKELAEEFGVTTMAISYIARGKRWKEIN